MIKHKKVYIDVLQQIGSQVLYQVRNKVWYKIEIIALKQIKKKIMEHVDLLMEL